jgi:PHD/YefM family antitoxin component YafN of YafNO toxin-antitoxin module
MTVSDLTASVQFVVDEAGNKKAVLLDLAVWEALLTQLEDQEDAEEMAQLRQADEEVISWEQAKAELRAGGVDV